MRVTPQQVRQIADLANLSLSDRNLEAYAKDLEEILTYVDQLNELDTSGVEPMAQVLHEGSVAPLRTDAAGPSLAPESALRCAPSAGKGHFKVPRVIER